MHVRRGLVAACAIAIGLAGCARDAGMSIDAPSIERVTAIEVWAEAPAGCEDAPVDALEWTLAGGAPELVVLVDHEARAVCVDTFDQVLALLDESDAPDEAVPLDGAPNLAELASAATTSVDPDPEPMDQPRGIVLLVGDSSAVDPDPEPMDQPRVTTIIRGGRRAVDPDPEPMRGPAPGTSSDLDP